MAGYSPAENHGYIYRSTKRLLSYNPGKRYTAWKSQVAKKLHELTGTTPVKVSPRMKILYTRRQKAFTETKFTFMSEKSIRVPCHLLVPRTGRKKYPVIICLQGHTSGMHISLGRIKSKNDIVSIKSGDRDFALRTIREGYAALVLEQRCFGENRSPHSRLRFFDDSNSSCRHDSMVSLLLGRTMAGERVWDVSRAIDILKKFREIDTGRIGCMGNSGGGTIAFYAACMDRRIKIAMPSCSFCTYWDSIGMIDHCEDNYLPGALKYFEHADLACLIAPRKLLVVAGSKDNIFPINAVRRNFNKARSIYRKAGAPGNCRLVTGPGGHRFYADLAWPVFNKLTGWKQK